ncbi:MAG TPA: hypothetical protein VGZ72_01425 [Stellaceae bacterium]|jgi:hypothetical protein|nr:hypothetical protein [Stellaceae bacterium]
MRGSRSDRRLAFAALLIAACVSVPAKAQVGPPIRLVQPPPSPIHPGAAVPLPAPDASESSQTLPPGVEAMPLAPVDPAWAGSLEASEGGLPGTLWQGTPKAFVTAALPQLQPISSPTLEDLARRLLLSNAIAPSGDELPRGRSLVAIRLDRLVALGYVDQAAELIDRLPWKGDPEPLDRLRVEIGFLKNDNDGACRQVQDAIGRYQDVWWDRAQIACQALAGDPGKAALGLSLLRERQVPRDQVFDGLIDAISGHAAKLDRMPDATPIRVALLAAAKLPLPADALQNADPAVLRAWATNGNVPAERRLAAAERAAALGALALDELRSIYTEIAFKPEERKTAIQQAGDNPRARALLYATAKQETIGAARAEALQSLLQAGLKRGEFPVTARLVAPLLLELEPSPDLDWFAPTAARALFALDRPLEAAVWAQVGGQAAQASLFLIARLAQGDTGPAWPKDGLRSILEGLQPKDATLEPGKLVLAGALLQSVGEPIKPADWAALVALPPAAGAPLPNAALWIDGREAVAGRRLGEALLDTLVMAQAGGRLSSEPIVIAEAVARLNALGMDVEARHLALEAALAAGF